MAPACTCIVSVIPVPQEINSPQIFPGIFTVPNRFLRSLHTELRKMFSVQIEILGLAC